MNATQWTVWTAVIIAAVPAVVLIIAWLWCALCAGSDADDRADEMLDNIRAENMNENGQAWSL
jgi:hypothetical protein